MKASQSEATVEAMAFRPWNKGQERSGFSRGPGLKAASRGILIRRVKTRRFYRRLAARAVIGSRFSQAQGADPWNSQIPGKLPHQASRSEAT